MVEGGVLPDVGVQISKYLHPLPYQLQTDKQPVAEEKNFFSMATDNKQARSYVSLVSRPSSPTQIFWVGEEGLGLRLELCHLI